MKEIEKQIPAGRRLKILDVGCGAGFFSILLAKEGHEVFGIDLTPEMIENAIQLAEEENADCCFQVMDAENPMFADETFDVVISRNLTWTLPNAEHAYGEWMRVLKTGGVLLNFDANYGKEDVADTKDFRRRMPISRLETRCSKSANGSNHSSRSAAKPAGVRCGGAVRKHSGRNPH